MATSGRSCRSRKRPPRSNVWQGCRLQARAGNWRSRCSRTFSRPLLACPNWPASSRSPSTPTLRHRSARRRAGMGRGASRWSHRRGHGRGLADRGPPRSSKSTSPGCIRPTPSTTESSRTRGLVGARRRQASPSSAARRGRPERHSPCVAKQEGQARQDGFRADRGAAQCVADWVGLGAWNVGESLARARICA